MDPIAYKKIMCNLTSHNFRGKRTIFRQPNIIFPRAAYRRLQVYGVFGHPNIWAKYEGGEVQRPNHSRTPTRSRTTRSLYSCAQSYAVSHILRNLDFPGRAISLGLLRFSGRSFRTCTRRVIRLKPINVWRFLSCTGTQVKWLHEAFSLSTPPIEPR